MEFGRVDSRLWRRRESRRLRKHPGSPLSFAGTSGFNSIRLCFIISIMTDTTTPRSLFLPTARQTNALLIVAFLCVGEAMYLRYMVMENATMSLACQGGLATWLCDSFRLVNCFLPASGVRLGCAPGCAAQPRAAVDRPGHGGAGGSLLRHCSAQCRPLGARGRRAYSELGASRADSRIAASPSKPAQNQTDCQLAKVSLNTM